MTITKFITCLSNDSNQSKNTHIPKENPSNIKITWNIFSELSSQASARLTLKAKQIAQKSQELYKDIEPKFKQKVLEVGSQASATLTLKTKQITQKSQELYQDIKPKVHAATQQVVQNIKDRTDKSIKFVAENKDVIIKGLNLVSILSPSSYTFKVAQFVKLMF